MRKKLFAVIMSVMMMVTFMPTMAFAIEAKDAHDTLPAEYDTTFVSGMTRANSKFVTWSNNNSVANYLDATGAVKVKAKADVVRQLEADPTHSGEWTGAIVAYALFDFNEDGNYDEYSVIRYYDVAYSNLYKINGITVDLDGMDYDDVFGDNGFYNKNVAASSLDAVLKFYVPDYIINSKSSVDEDYGTTNFVYGSVSKTKKATALSDLQITHNHADFVDTADVTVDVPENDAEKQFVNQQISINVFVTPAKNGENKNDFENTVYGLDSLKTITLTVNADKPDYTDARFIVDGDVDNQYADSFRKYYDGAEHEVTQIELPGVTTAFELWNKATNKYEAVEKLTFKNAGEYHVKATTSDKDGKHPATYFIIYVDAPSSISYVFDDSMVKDIKPLTGQYQGFYVGSNFNAKDFVTVTTGRLSNLVNSGTTEEREAKRAAATKAAKKAFEADKEALLAMFDDFCEIKTEESKYQKGIYTSKIAFKELTNAERKALLKKNEELLANYTVTFRSQGTDVQEALVIGANNEMNFQVKDSVKFTKAPLNKTYKAKNGKLAKAKKFTVKATAKSGAEVTYSIANGGSRIVINENTGKVTLKKGLKKRTYNVKITATAGSYYGTSKTVTVKIKVK